jgi:hypothetical protein
VAAYVAKLEAMLLPVAERLSRPAAELIVRAPGKFPNCCSGYFVSEPGCRAGGRRGHCAR